MPALFKIVNLSFFLIFISVVLINCRATNRLDKISAVLVERKFPMVDTVINGRWDLRKYEPNYSKVYYHKNLVLVQQSSWFTSIEMIDGIVVKQSQPENKYNSVVFCNNSSHPHAMFCDSNNLETARIVNKDSILKHQWAFQNYMDELFAESAYQLVYSKPGKKDTLMEKYKLDNQKDTTLHGHCRLKFVRRKTGDPPYRLSDSLERSKGMRLVGFNVVADARSLRKGELPINRLEMPYWLSDLKVDNKEELLRIFEMARSKLPCD